MEVSKINYDNIVENRALGNAKVLEGGRGALEGNGGGMVQEIDG